MQVQYLRQQILIAEAVRIASCKKNDYVRWVKSKERAIWKLVKTDEQKEAEAMRNWDALIKTQDKMLVVDKKKEKNGSAFFDEVQKKKQAILDKIMGRNKRK